jgi:hypothetical protein
MAASPATASSLPEILDTDDGVTYPRAAGLAAPRHFLGAFLALHEVPDLSRGLMDSIAIDRLAELLGGEHWADIAQELLQEVLAEDATT